MQASEFANESPHEAIAGLSQSLEKTFDQNRMLWSEMARFTRNESMRFVQLQMDHANHAFAQIDSRRDLSSLIGAQQEWFKETMQDYASQSLRYAEMMRMLAGKVRSRTEQAAGEEIADLPGHKAAHRTKHAAE